MAAATTSLSCNEYDTPAWPVRITIDGVVADITGHTLSWMICKKNSTVPALTQDVTDHSDPEGGESDFVLTPADIETIGGPGVYDVFCVDVDEEDREVTWISASLTVLKRPARG
jgi:hypothetical protein